MTDIVERLRVEVPTFGLSFDAAAEIERLRAERYALRADAERLEWAMRHVSGAAWRAIGVVYGAGCDRAAIDAQFRRSRRATSARMRIGRLDGGVVQVGALVVEADDAACPGEHARPVSPVQGWKLRARLAQAGLQRGGRRCRRR